jgi:ribosomal protein L23
MELSRIIMGQIVTEKSERQKASDRSYTLRVHPDATKVDVTNALEKHFDVTVQSVRMHWLRVKARALGGSRILTKRHRSKRAFVTLAPKSKALDLTAFKVS